MEINETNTNQVSETQTPAKKSKRRLIAFLIPVAIILLIIIIASSGGSKKTTKVDYTICSTSEYASNGHKAIGYRVSVSKSASRSELEEVFEAITDGDGYKNHTVWFYSTSSKATGGDTYDVAMIDDDDGYISYRKG